MIFIKDDLKYDTNKMEKVIEYSEIYCGNTIKRAIYRSKKGRWCRLSLISGYKILFFGSLSDSEVKEILSNRDIYTCEKYFGEF